MAILRVLVVTAFAAFVAGCADDDPRYWCQAYCAAVGRQTRRCLGTSEQSARRECEDSYACERVTAVRDRAALIECLEYTEGICQVPRECEGQFTR